MNDMSDLLGGYYTVPDAARLLEVAPQKVRGWLAGYPRTKADPLLENEVGWAEKRFALSFTNLMEVRFVAAFSGIGVQTRAIREMLTEAKELLKHPHPFATNAIFKTDGKRIFVEAAEATEDRVLYDLQAKNWAMHEIIVQSLIDGVEYDPQGDAKAWHPRRYEAPNVIVRAAQAFGQPIMDESGVPTRILFDAFLAEGETEESVSRWYGVNPETVKEAVRFETLLKRAL
ncbi:hypothetical protein [Methyloligella solikamskensis]|uniref:DUF433 domain-containing protein n=1 Tax=Methyloligella solikamskensis TaxID=1177756 RepID=A0ABW3JDT4_9HYPH